MATGLAVASPATVTAGDPESQPFTSLLRDAGISPDVTGLAGFLELHAPSDECRRHYRELLTRLRDDDFFLRESAMLELQRLPVQLPDELALAAQSPDGEQRWRAEVVKTHASENHRDVLFAAYIVIRDSQLPGLAPGLLHTIPYCDRQPLQSGMTSALVATATRDDAQTLRLGINAEQSWVRIAAAAAMDRALGDDALCDLLPLLDDPDDVVRVATADLLARRDDPDGLRALGELLESKMPVVRARSIRTLRTLLRVSLPYSGLNSALERRHYATAWREEIEKYLAGDGADGNSPVHRRGADILICTSDPGSELVELRRDGSIASVVELPAAMDCQSLPGGCRLVVEALHGRAVELDAGGAEVWELRDLPDTTTCARRLPSGNTLVATLDGALTEYDPGGGVVRAMYLEGGIQEATVLPDEHLLVVTDVPGHIIEFGIDRQELWRSPRIDHLASACPTTAGGYIAVCLRPQPRLLSVLRSGAVQPFVVECEHPRQVRQALPGGLLILDAGGILQLTDETGPARRVIEQRYLRSMAPVQF